MLDTRYDTCPECGGKKHVSALACRNCKKLSQNTDSRNSVNYDLLSEAWLYQFVGLFYGEGSAMIIKNNSSFSPCLVLRLRDDDSATVLQIRNFLGGRILYSKRNSYNPKHGNQIEWRTSNVPHCLDVCNLIISHTLFEAKKKNDVEQVLSFCEWRLSIPEYWTDEHRTEALVRLQNLSESRKYR